MVMASEDAADVEILLAELVSRPAWHRQAAWRRSGPGHPLPGVRHWPDGCDVGILRELLGEVGVRNP